MKSLGGRCVLVAGAAGGVGEGITRSLLCEGATVIAVSRSAQRLAELERHLKDDDAIAKGGGELVQFSVDMADPDWPETSTRLTNSFGRLDGAVITIGDWGQPGRRSIMDTSNATWEEMISANLTSRFRAIRTLVPALAPHGALVTLAGFSADLAFPGSAAIAAANAATKSLVRSLAAELELTGPRAYVLLLGMIRTRPRMGAGIDNPDWYSADQIGDHVTELVAGRGAHREATVHYLVERAMGVLTEAPVPR